MQITVAEVEWGASGCGQELEHSTVTVTGSVDSEPLTTILLKAEPSPLEVADSVSAGTSPRRSNEYSTPSVNRRAAAAVRESGVIESRLSVRRLLQLRQRRETRSSAVQQKAHRDGCRSCRPIGPLELLLKVLLT